MTTRVAVLVPIEVRSNKYFSKIVNEPVEGIPVIGRDCIGHTLNMHYFLKNHLFSSPEPKTQVSSTLSVVVGAS